MRKQILLVAAIVVISVTNAAYAQTSAIRAEIPFDFSVQNKTYPAGKYIIGQPSADHGQGVVWSLRGSKKQIVMLAKTKQDVQRGDKLSMIFNRYGSQYFLSGFVTTTYKVALPSSRSERAAKNQIRLAKAVAPNVTVIGASLD